MLTVANPTEAMPTVSMLIVAMLTKATPTAAVTLYAKLGASVANPGCHSF